MLRMRPMSRIEPAIIVILSLLCFPLVALGQKDSEPVALPPDPGDKGKTTLAGIDSNQNGLRDDIERFIEENSSGNKYLKKLLYVYGQGLQRFILESEDREKTIANNKSFSQAFDCVSRPGRDNQTDLFIEVRERQINTPDRKKAFHKAISQLNEVVLQHPTLHEIQQACREMFFNPE